MRHASLTTLGVSLLGVALLCFDYNVTRADARSDYRQCVAKQLPASVREPSCQALLRETRGDRVMQERGYNALGHALVGLERYQDAVVAFTRTIRLNPKIAGYYDNRQNAYRQAGELDDALSDAYSAVKIAPTYSFVYRSRGSVFAQMAQWNRAIDDFSKAIELDPKDSDLYVERGKARMGAARTEQAIGDFSQALALDGESIEAYKFRGLARRQLGQTGPAADDLTKYQLVHPDDAEIAGVLSAIRSGQR